jgi:MFS family permease
MTTSGFIATSVARICDATATSHDIQYTPPMPEAAKPLDRATQRRLRGTLFAASALNRTAFIAAITVTAIAAEDMLGSAQFAGVPAAVATVGVAVGTTTISDFMAARGRRIGFVVGLSVGVVGAALGAVAVAAQSFLLLLIALYLFGMGSGADRLSRYAAADVAGPARAAPAIALIVWAGTIGSIVGPALLGPAESVAALVDLDAAAGVYTVAALFVAASASLLWIFLRPDPLTPTSQSDVEDAATSRQVRSHFRTAAGRYALLSLVIGQVVMALIMAMTPIHIRGSGAGISLVGIVISAHTLGMFAFSPVTGWLAPRIGNVRVILIGQALLIVSAIMAMPAAGDERVLLISALFLLGLGWNLGFVAASALLTEGTHGAARLRIQGIGDSVTWSASAVAVFSSGVLLDWGGYARLNLIGIGIVMVALLYRVSLGRFGLATS